jgi:hypothetical protein
MSQIQLIYASAALAPFSEGDLQQLLSEVRAKNERLGISGLLLFHDGSFLQFLEGNSEVVHELYNTIQTDSRHGNIMKSVFSLAARRKGVGRGREEFGVATVS